MVFSFLVNSSYYYLSCAAFCTLPIVRNVIDKSANSRILCDLHLARIKI